MDQVTGDRDTLLRVTRRAQTALRTLPWENAGARNLTVGEVATLLLLADLTMERGSNGAPTMEQAVEG